MKFHQFKNHRNTKYLTWLRKKACVISGQKAQCAHHIRLGTNGGSGLKPSDYFCIPLLNEYHTTGMDALHIIGEETFLTKFKISPKEIFINYLIDYLKEEYQTLINKEDFEAFECESTISFLVDLIEQKRPKKKESSSKSKLKPKSQQKPSTPSVTESEFYQRAKEAKNLQDKEQRKKLKSQKSVAKTTFKGNEYYERAKELKREQDKELRKKLKSSDKNKKTSSFKGNEYYEKAKEAKREMDRKLREENKAKASKYRKEQYKRLKERNSQA